LRPYGALLGRGSVARGPRHDAASNGLPWWLPVGIGVGVLVYATVLTVGKSVFGFGGTVLVTLVLVHYCVTLYAAAIERMSR
jgi:hypothetical protein